MKQKAPELPKAWKDCPDILPEDSFTFTCPTCRKDYTVERRRFEANAPPGAEAPAPLDARMWYLSGARATVAYLIACAITLIVVFSIRDLSRAGIYIIGIPVLFVATVVLRRLFRTRMGLWTYACPTCGQTCRILSDGDRAAYGTIESGTPAASSEQSQVRERAMTSLLEDLRHGTAERKVEAAAALGVIADGRRIEPLITSLGDDDERVRKASVSALAGTGDTSAVRAIVERSRTEQSRSVVAHTDAVLTQHMGSYAAVRYISRGLESSDPHVFDLACEAFTRKGDRDALDALVAAMKASNAA